MPLPADQVVNGSIEGHRKPGNRASGNPAGDLKRMFEFKYGKSHFNGLVPGNGPRCADKHAVCAYVFDDIPERPLLDRVLDDDKRGPARMGALIDAAFQVHFML